jgi:hypothetical protein
MSLRSLSDDLGEPVIVLAELWWGQTRWHCDTANRKSGQHDLAGGFVLNGA